MKCEKCGGVFPNRTGRFCGTCNWNHPQFVYGESNTMEDFDRRAADVAEMRKELLTHKREGKKIDAPFVVPPRGKYASPTMAEFLGPNHEEQISDLTERIEKWKCYESVHEAACRYRTALVKISEIADADWENGATIESIAREALKEKP